MTLRQGKGLEIAVKPEIQLGNKRRFKSSGSLGGEGKWLDSEKLHILKGNPIMKTVNSVRDPIKYLVSPLFIKS